MNPAKSNTKYQWWFNAEDGGCKTLSSGGEIEEHSCESSIDDDSIIRKPICQLGILVMILSGNTFIISC